jgi:hypothetical protein
VGDHRRLSRTHEGQNGTGEDLRTGSHLLVHAANICVDREVRFTDIARYYCGISSRCLSDKLGSNLNPDSEAT